MDRDSYKDLKEEIIKFAHQPLVRKQLREQIDRLCEMVEERIEIITPIIKEAHKRHSDPKIHQQARQKQIDILKSRIKEYDKPCEQVIEVLDRDCVERILQRRPNGTINGILQLPEAHMQNIYRLLVDEWKEIKEHWTKKEKTPEIAKRIADYDYIRSKLCRTESCLPSDIIEKEGAQKDGYLFGYEHDTYCKGISEVSGRLYWYPSEPPNPIEWFPCSSVCGGKLEFRQMKPDEEFMVNSVILASIHDREWIGRNRYTSQLIYRNEPYTGRYFDRDKFLNDLWFYFDKPGSQKQTLLELALQNVRDESNTKPASGGKSGGTEQVIGAIKDNPSEKPTPPSETKEQPWEDDNPDYMPNSEAIVTFTDNKLSLPRLTKKLNKSENTIRFMRNGHRCKVHIGDFIGYCKKRFVNDKFAQEIADQVIADREAVKASMRTNERPK